MANPEDAYIVKFRAWLTEKIIEKKGEWDAFRQSKRPQVEALYEQMGGALIRGAWGDVGCLARQIQRAVNDMDHYCIHGRLPENSILT